MKEIAVFLFDANVIDRDKLTKLSFKRLEELAEKHYDESQVFYSILEFQEAFNDEMIDEVNSWIVFKEY